VFAAGSFNPQHLMNDKKALENFLLPPQKEATNLEEQAWLDESLQSS
jgi:hypothetical protein